MTFEWDEYKNKENLLKHNLLFDEAQEAFFDKKRIIYTDAPLEVSEAIERNRVMADFLPSPEVLMRKEKPRRQYLFGVANSNAVSV